MKINFKMVLYQIKYIWMACPSCWLLICDLFCSHHTTILLKKFFLTHLHFIWRSHLFNDCLSAAIWAARRSRKVLIIVFTYSNDSHFLSTVLNIVFLILTGLLRGPVLSILQAGKLYLERAAVIDGWLGSQDLYILPPPLPDAILATSHPHSQAMNSPENI